MVELNHWVEDWISARCESEGTALNYRARFKNFGDFCSGRGKDLLRIVEEWREVKRLGEVKKDAFVDEWSDLVRVFHTFVKGQYAPLMVKNFLTVIKSFFKFWQIPVNVDLPKNACVIYHNRDLKREEIRQILTYATPRDRVIWLVMLESGMRGSTAVQMKYWQIKDDFEENRIPMRILLPSASLKDHVGDRWTFIGEDGLRELKEYLKPRLPLKREDYVFASEKEGLVKGEQFSASSLSVKFNRLVQKLDMTETRGGRPKSVRMHSLRKYFRNNMKADSAMREFWMGHSLGVDAHYISRDAEAHRKEYAKGYDSLRVYEQSPYSISDLAEQLRAKDQEIKNLKQRLERIDEASADKLEALLKRVEQLEKKLE